MKKYYLLLLVVLFMFPVINVSAQISGNWDDYSRWSVGVEFGGNIYDGDISISNSETQVLTFPSIGAYVEYGVSPIVSGGLAYNYHRLDATNLNYSFTSNMHMLYPFMGFNLVNIFNRNAHNKWGFWATVGFGAANYTSHKKKKDSATGNFEDYADLKHQFALAIPVSAQLEYNITDRIAVNARYQYTGFNRDDVEGGGPAAKDKYSGVTNDFLANMTIGLRWKFTKSSPHVRNTNMQTYNPICCNNKEIEELREAIKNIKPSETDSLEREIENLKQRLDTMKCCPDAVPAPAPVEDKPVVLVPAVKDEKEVIVVFHRTMHGINFETAKDIIKPESYPVLDNVVDLLKENEHYLLEINGHTDDVGRKDYNLDLSERRANSVKRYMVRRGIASDRITTNGYGDTRPIANNNTAAGRSRNRRVDFTVSYEKNTLMESEEGVIE